MEKPEQHIDHVFKNKLAGASVAPPAFVWTNVEKELRRRKKPPLFWWWTSGLAILLAAGGAYWLQHAGQTSGTDLVTVPVPPVLQQPATSGADPGAKENNAAALSSTTTNNPESNLQTTASADIPFTPYIKKSSTGSTGRNIDVKGGAQQAPETWSDWGATPATTPHTNFTSETQQASTTNERTPTPLLPSIKTDFLTSKIVHPAAKRWPTKVAKKKKKDENCYDFASHRTVLMADAYVGPQTADRSFAAESAENKPYLNKRVQTEGRGWGFDGGLRVTALFREHFTATAGIEYNQFTEVFSYVDPTSIEFDVHVKIDPTTGAATFDTSDIRFGERRVKSYNRYGFLDIPVALGYEVRQGRGGIRFQGGAALNLLFHKRGTILSPDTGKPVSFTPGNPGAIEVFRSNAGFSVQGSMQFFWSYEPRTRFFAEPYFKKILDPVTLDSHPVSTRYNLWGARFGVTKIF